MPELPDVEGFRRDWQAYAAGRRVAWVRGPDPDVLRNTSTSGLGRALARRRFADPERWGKWLFAPTAQGPGLLLHFGMTGSIAAEDRGDELTPLDRIVWHLDAGWVAYRSVRKLGGVWLVRDDAEREQITGVLGPDAATVDTARLQELLTGRRGGIKAALMDQRLLAGVGNELSDEILVRAGIHPRTAVEHLDERDIDRLAGGLAETIEQSVAAGRIPDDDGWLNAARGGDAAACPRCGAPLASGTVAGRTAWWCTAEQPDPP